MIGEPKYDVSQIKEAYEYILSLEIDSQDNKLWSCLHSVIWHNGIDRVDWILRNKDLIQEVITYSSNDLLPKDLAEKFRKSILYYKNLNR